MTAKMHRVHIAEVGEGVVHIPGGVPFEASDVEEFPIGSYMRLGNKEFIYAKAGGTLNTDLGAKCIARQAVAYNNVARAYAAGVTEVIVDVAATDGDGSGNIAVDALVGGEILFFPHDENSFTRGIISNTVVSGGDEMTVGLDSPTPVALTEDTDDMELMASPYYSVQSSTDGRATVMGIPTVAATIGQYLWLQVSGPNWIAPQSGVGEADLDFECVFRHDGSVELQNSTTKLHQQHAGCVVAQAIGNGQGAPFLMLHIAH